MSELQQRLNNLNLRVDHMGMRVEQAVFDALEAVDNADADAGERVHRLDSVIDREEIEIEQECIRLLALYQPTAIDLRTICTVIKVNSDLERIADLASGIGKRVKHVVVDAIDLKSHAGFQRLRRQTLDILGVTVRMLSTTDTDSARHVIESDPAVDQAHRDFVSDAIDSQTGRIGGVEAATTMIYLGKALERIADLCTNIAEDIIFQRTGEVVRHSGAFGVATK